ncbi:MAG: glutamate-5-semialdehyde dehydrogenase [Armatimonadota bacterium]|nr:MAG: glutamate-5-semialdehyde dehydrogenase [Armatimonadota bacterium]
MTVTSAEQEVIDKAQAAHVAARDMAALRTLAKNRALTAMADALTERQQFVLDANSADVRAARDAGLSEALVDRLLLSEKRIAAMAAGLREVAALPDPVGEVIEGWRRPNGLEILKVRVPLGVVSMIYESRPNVTVDAAGLCMKAGNAVVLRGGSEALRSNVALARVIADAAYAAGVPQGALQLIETAERAAAQQLMRLNQYVDVLIPRGGEGLIRAVVENSTVPVIETGVGNCHVYVDESADLDMAERIVINAKCQRPGVCNACETLLVHRAVAARFLKQVGPALVGQGVELRGCDLTREVLPEAGEATDDDWRAEYLDLILAVRVVESFEDALAHIATYSTKHSEAIITGDYERAQRFCEGVDAAAVYVNASTRFTDGGEFGLGAEIGISTQKLHGRGPMGLRELTTYKYVIQGAGQIRQ